MRVVVVLIRLHGNHSRPRRTIIIGRALVDHRPWRRVVVMRPLYIVSRRTLSMGIGNRVILKEVFNPTSRLSLRHSRKRSKNQKSQKKLFHRVLLFFEFNFNSKSGKEGSEKNQNRKAGWIPKHPRDNLSHHFEGEYYVVHGYNMKDSKKKVNPYFSFL